MSMTPQRVHNPWYLTFHDLMPYRVREILLVSSPYDAFTLEEDGRLTEKVFTEYSELNLSTAPRLTHVSSGAAAMRMLAERRFDLVVTMIRIADTNVSAFARQVKTDYPTLPVVLLVLTEADLLELPGGVDSKAIDRVFVWTGDARMLLSIIKLVEDAMNVAHDTSAAGVRVIIVVEDSARRYSSFLSFLYQELMAQSESLVAEGVNDLHRLMRMRTRPKILLATTYEEALAAYQRFPDYVVAIISDVRFPRGGEEDPQAGFELVRAIRAINPDLPFVLESAEQNNAGRAAELGVHFLDKASPTFLRSLRLFLNEILGFGDFVFRLPDRTEVARARDMYELEQVLRTLPAASLEHHATRNHFSVWLMARSMFALAILLRPQGAERFGDVEGVRDYLLKALREERLHEQEGVITDYSSRRPSGESHFIRIAKGSIGGKARGLAFVGSLIARERLAARFAGLRIRTPRSIVIGTDEFDRFVDTNRIGELVQHQESSRVILERSLAGQLSADLMRDLRKVVSWMNGPLAVRSSSLLEDSQLQPFAGIYATVMLPNNNPEPEVRFAELCQAIKTVYASTYSEDARAYIAGTPYSIEEEKMAVVVQEIVGRSYGTRFYPDISGVALSYNYYPVSHQRANEGLALVALGLGYTVVKGGAALQFSPSNPSILAQYGTAREMMRYSQSSFYALDLAKLGATVTGEDTFLTRCELDLAEQDGPLEAVGSVYSFEDDLIRDDLTRPGPRVVTFNNILKWNALPLAPALADLLKLTNEGLGCPVEIEFAVHTGTLVRRGRSADAEPPTLYVLQVRPQATQLLDNPVETGEFAADEMLCRTEHSLGHGIYDEIRDIVYVARKDLGPHETPAIAEQVGEINAKLMHERTPYLLIGPGRWGSSDPRLGIPVKWAQIAGAKVIVETAFDDRDVEPSQAAHFFHNVTSFHLGYLTVGGRSAPQSQMNAAWFEALPITAQVGEVRHVRLAEPLRIYLDGRRSSAVILKPRGGGSARPGAEGAANAPTTAFGGS